MEPTKPKIKEYAEGWITEQAGTEVPGFLKLALTGQVITHLNESLCVVGFDPACFL